MSPRSRDERCDCLGIVLGGHIHGKDCKALVVVIIVDGFEGLHFTAAGRAPGCPQIDQDRLASQVGELYGFTFRCLQFKIGSEKILPGEQGFCPRWISLFYPR